ncbi:matrixin family metalloprotease [Heyndrickxia acidiproducens]|uniref:matrixin family metalloprotease n=1 Tax=Heyndrickxia acidiproducens TaxID=1121084 RepID=UPI00058B38DF|nr:matrixin family metalloprotease [Heyndrickxia acidiproducens]
MVAIFTMLLLIPVTNASAAAKLLSWDLVDSGKHMDWDGGTKYQSYFNSGVSVWNGYKKGVIRKDTATRVQDVKISDYTVKSSTAGVTSSAGTIKFNKYTMDKLSGTKKKNVAIHELGHALGLAHNTLKDVMYKYVSTKTKLSSNDKASYNAAYKRY